MTALLSLKLLTALVSVALAGGILARDHGLKANRTIAALLICNGFWASGEFALFQATDPVSALWISRATGLGWIPVGVLCAHASITVSGMAHHPVTRILPACYAAVIVLIPLSLATDWVIVSMERGPYAWHPTFGPGMILAYLAVAVPLVSMLGCWREVARLADTGGQLVLARIVFYGISAAFVAGTATAVMAPLFGNDAIGGTTTLIAGVGVATAWTLNRYGHSLISPDSFAREVLDTLDDGVVVVGEGGILRDANRAFLRMIGATEGEALGRALTTWLPEYAEAVTNRLSSDSSIFLELRTGEDERVPIVLSAPVDCVGGGRRVGQAFLVRDRREVVSLQRQLAVSARLAAVGDLTKSISNSINEPIALVRSEFEGLAIDWQVAEDVVELAGLEDECREALDEGHELIAECVEGIDRISSVVGEVTGFSGRKKRKDFSPQALDQIVIRALKIARVQAPEGMEIEARLDPDVEVFCHFAEIERAVMNLLVNAIHALEDRPPEEAKIAVALVAHGDKALLHIEDNGCGIESDALERIFDPFFTTKPVGKGTGLGLAIAYHTIRFHRGEIRISSVPGQGTSAAVELPRLLPELCPEIRNDGGPREDVAKAADAPA